MHSHWSRFSSDCRRLVLRKHLMGIWKSFPDDIGVRSSLEYLSFQLEENYHVFIGGLRMKLCRCRSLRICLSHDFVGTIGKSALAFSANLSVIPSSYFVRCIYRHLVILATYLRKQQSGVMTHRSKRCRAGGHQRKYLLDAEQFCVLNGILWIICPSESGE